MRIAQLAESRSRLLAQARRSLFEQEAEIKFHISFQILVDLLAMNEYVLPSNVAEARLAQEPRREAGEVRADVAVLVADLVMLGLADG